MTKHPSSAAPAHFFAPSPPSADFTFVFRRGEGEKIGPLAVSTKIAAMHL